MVSRVYSDGRLRAAGDAGDAERLIAADLRRVLAAIEAVTL